MNNNDISIIKKENQSKKSETDINSQNNKNSPEKTLVKNISLKNEKNEKDNNNNHLYKELLIEDNSSDYNAQNNSKENENNSKSIEHINDLNDYYSSEEYNDIENRPKNLITVNDIIGEDTKKEINLNIMDEVFNNFYPGKVSTKSYGPIKAYAANTNQGIARDYNEDRVSIIININQPNNRKDKEKIPWPKASYFSVFDGHGGNKCAEFLRDNLLRLICDNEFFPSDIEKAIKYGFSEADRVFLENAAKDGELIDNSGSCGLILLIIENKIYIANVGDSRCIVSMKNGLIKKDVTRDHKPNYPYEKERIVANGGRIYQTQTPLNQNLESNDNLNENETSKNNLILLGPHRVFPGSLSVSRTIGDAAAKLAFLGGNPKVVISEPDIYFYDLDKDDIDFLILGCDGIYDQLTSQDVFKCAYMIIDYSKNYNLKEKNNNSIKGTKNEESNDEIDLYSACANIVDFILKASMSRKSFDNVTCLIIAFKDLLNTNSQNNKEDIKDNDKNKLEIIDNKKHRKEINKEKSDNNNIDKNDEKLPILNNSKANDLLLENNKNENIEKKNNNVTKKKLVIDKIQIKSIQKEEKIKNNQNKYNKHIELYSDNNESPNKKDINSGELSHRAIHNNLLKEFKYKANKIGENDNNIYYTHKNNKLTLSTSKMKKTKSKELLVEKNSKVYNIEKEKDKDKENNNPINNIHNSTNNNNEGNNNKNISLKKNRFNATKRYFLSKKIKPLFIDNKLTNNNKYQNNFTLKITTFNTNNTNNINNIHHMKTGSSVNKKIPGLGDLNLYQNLNLKEKNPTVFYNNIPKITNINTIMVKNNIKNKITLNDLLPVNNGKNNDNNNKNANGIRLKSLNKKSISFYNNYAFNDLVNHNNKLDKNLYNKNQQTSQFDLFNINSNNGRSSYGNIKMKSPGNFKSNENNGNKFHFSNEDKYKIRLGKPINICAINSNNNIISKNSKRLNGNDLKGKKLIHNLTEDLLFDNYRTEMPNINKKNKVNNNLSIGKKLNFI